MMERFDNQFKSWGKVFDSAAVSGERTVYTDPLPLGGTGVMGLWMKATSAGGTPRVRLFYEMSYDDDTDNFVTPVGANDIVVLSGENPVVKVLTGLAPLPWIRFGAEGISGNPDDSILTEVIYNT